MTALVTLIPKSTICEVDEHEQTERRDLHQYRSRPLACAQRDPLEAAIPVVDNHSRQSLIDILWIGPNIAPQENIFHHSCGQQTSVLTS